MNDNWTCIYENQNKAGVCLEVYTRNGLIRLRLFAQDDEDVGTVDYDFDVTELTDLRTVIDEWEQSADRQKYVALGKVAYEGYAKETGASGILYADLSTATQGYWTNSARAICAYVAVHGLNGEGAQ